MAVMTVAAALRLEVFSRVGMKVHAGENNLDRVVRWVHPTEIPDIAQFLRGGEMLLTAGLGIGSTAQSAVLAPSPAGSMQASRSNR